MNTRYGKGPLKTQIPDTGCFDRQLPRGFMQLHLLPTPSNGDEKKRRSMLQGLRRLVHNGWVPAVRDGKTIYVDPVAAIYILSETKGKETLVFTADHPFAKHRALPWQENGPANAESDWYPKTILPGNDEEKKSEESAKTEKTRVPETPGGVLVNIVKRLNHFNDRIEKLEHENQRIKEALRGLV